MDPDSSESLTAWAVRLDFDFRLGWDPSGDELRLLRDFFLLFFRLGMLGMWSEAWAMLTALDSVDMGSGSEKSDCSGDVNTSWSELAILLCFEKDEAGSGVNQ